MSGPDTTLPRGWTDAVLSDITSVCRRGRPPSYAGGSTPVINQKCVRRATEVDLGAVKLTNEEAKPLPGWAVLQEGDVLVNSTGSGTLGRVAWLRTVPGRLTADTHVTIVRPRSEVVRSAYLGWFLHSRQAMFEAMATGSTDQKELRPGELQGVRVPLPPLEAQDDIVALLEEHLAGIDEGLSHFQRSRGGVEAFEGALYAAALSGELAAHVRGVGNETILTSLGAPSLATSDCAPEWPVHWAAARLGEVVSRVTSGSRDWKPYYGRGDGVFVLTQGVRMRSLDLSKSISVDPPMADTARARSAIKKDDILVTIVGAGVGNTARVPREAPEHFVCQSLALVRPAEPTMSRFLELYLTAPLGGQRYFASRFYGQGRPHLSFDDIKEMPVPVPPLDEQRHIVDAFDRQMRAALALRGCWSDATEQGEDLRKSVLHAAFSGGLTPGRPVRGKCPTGAGAPGSKEAPEPNTPVRPSSRSKS